MNVQRKNVVRIKGNKVEEEVEIIQVIPPQEPEKTDQAKRKRTNSRFYDTSSERERYQGY